MSSESKESSSRLPSLPFSFLTIVPRGLQNVVSETLIKQAHTITITHDDHGEIERDAGLTRKGIPSVIDDLDISIWNQEMDHEKGKKAIEQLLQNQQQKLKRSEQKTQHYDDVSKMKQKSKSLTADTDDYFPPDMPIGSLELRGQYISVGYYRDDNLIDSNNDVQNNRRYTSCWSCTGVLTGSVWMQFDTYNKSISQNVVMPSRCIGPSLALVTIQDDNDCLSSENYQHHSLDDITNEFSRHIQSLGQEQRESSTLKSTKQTFGTISQRLQIAFDMWKNCVITKWKHQLPKLEYERLLGRIRTNQLRFRISCVRQESLQTQSAYNATKESSTTSEEFSYPRHDFCKAIMDKCGQFIVPDHYITDISKHAADGGNESIGWTVDLEQFDIELVFLILPPGSDDSTNGRLALGLSLCPYSLLNSKSFAHGGIPPDLSLPYIGGDMFSGIVRLRPTTAHLLLELAELKNYDIVLDPFAGVGTIPIEADKYYTAKNCIGLGVDIVLNNPIFTKIAGALDDPHTKTRIKEEITSGAYSSSLLIAGDAAYLPIRTASVDAIVTDMPFGQQCLSVNELHQLLPVVFYESARILEPETGRMVLLCGGIPNRVIASLDQLSGEYWQKPLQRVSPVTIGGLLAWIIIVHRNQKGFHCIRVDETQQNGHILNRVRKLTERRDRKNLQRQSDSVEQNAGKRRLKRIA